MSLNQYEAVVLTKQKRIAEITREHRGENLKSLAHNIDLEWLYVANRKTRKDGTPGIDGITAEDYEKNLKLNYRKVTGKV